MQIAYTVVIVCLCVIGNAISDMDDGSSGQPDQVEDVLDELTLDNARSDAEGTSQPDTIVTTEEASRDIPSASGANTSAEPPETTNTTVLNETSPTSTWSTSTETSTSTTPTTSTMSTTSTTSATTWTTSSEPADWYEDDDDDDDDDDEEDDEDESCYVNPLLQTFCVLPADLQDVSFWDLYFVMFSDTVVDALVMDCGRGEWCLRDRFDYWESLVMERVDMVRTSDIATDMCAPEVAACVEAIPGQYSNCKSYKQMQFTSEVIRLVCDLKQNPELTPMCYRRTLEMLHVTFADIMRNDDEDDGEIVEDICNSPETHMAKGLICISNSCPGEGKKFKGFQPWNWFISEVSNLIPVCNINIERCEVLLQPNAWMFGTSDVEIFIGIIVASMITLFLIMFLGCYSWRRYRKTVILKDGYQQLLTENDEA